MSKINHYKVALMHDTGARTAKDLPKHVERYVDEGKDQGLDEGEAWAVAWSRYCKYKNPDSPHCKKDSPSDYFPNQGKKQAADDWRRSVKDMTRQMRRINDTILRRYEDISREIGDPPEHDDADWDARRDEMVEKAGINRLEGEKYDIRMRMTSVIAKALLAGVDPKEMGLTPLHAERIIEAHKKGKAAYTRSLNKVIMAVTGKSMYRRASAWRNEDFKRLEDESKRIYKALSKLGVEVAEAEHRAGSREMSDDLRKAFRRLQSAMRAVDGATRQFEQW